MIYSIEPGGMDNNISKILSSKYGQKLLGSATHATNVAKKFGASALKTAPKTAIQKTAEATGYLTGNNIADKIAKVSKTSPKTVTSETENMEFDREIPKEMYILSEKRQ